MRTQSSGPAERGIVLLLALVALLLISAVAASLLYMTATESTLVGYQRSNTRVFDAARGGLEEGRARLSTSDPSFLGGATFNITFPGAVGQVLYIVNPGAGETITLATVRNAASPFYDWEYDREWGPGALAAATVVNPTPPPATPLTSDMIPLAGLVTLPEMQYKWVRVNILTEQAANRDVNGDGVLDNTIPITWDSVSNRMNILVAPPNAMVDRDGDGIPESQLDQDFDGAVEVKERLGRYVYRVTALARQASTGATRLVQYDVSAPLVNLPFPAAVSLIGPTAACGPRIGCDPAIMGSCDAPTDFGPSNAMDSQGQDQAPGAPPGEGGPAVGCTDPATCLDCKNELAEIMRTANWTGNDSTSATGTGDISAQAGPMATTSGIQFLINTIGAVADYTFNAGDTPPQVDPNPANDTVNPPPGEYGHCDATINNPKVTVVNGDVTFDAGAGYSGGCGVLLVTGRLNVAGSWSWKGLILVLGEGYFDSAGTASMQGAQVVGRIYCQLGDPAPCPCAGPAASPPAAAPGCQGDGVLASPYGSVFRFNGGGSGGWDYNSMYINNAFGSGAYRVLAYREIGR